MFRFNTTDELLASIENTQALHDRALLALLEKRPIIWCCRGMDKLEQAVDDLGRLHEQIVYMQEVHDERVENSLRR